MSGGGLNPGSIRIRLLQKIDVRREPRLGRLTKIVRAVHDIVAEAFGDTVEGRLEPPLPVVPFEQSQLLRIVAARQAERG